MTDNHAAEVEVRQTDLEAREQEARHIYEECIAPFIDEENFKQDMEKIGLEPVGDFGVHPDDKASYSQALQRVKHERRKINAVRKKISASNLRRKKEQKLLERELNRA